MKIAFASNDGSNIGAHFGRAEFYVVIETNKREILNRRLMSKISMECNCYNEKGSHSNEEGESREVFETIKDCKILIANTMCPGAYQCLEELGLQIVLTELVKIDKALKAFLDGKLIHRPVLLQ